MAEINVTMVGGRRTGKTSVLAAMQSCFEAVTAQSAIHIASNDYQTLDELEAKFREAEDFFRERNSKKRSFTPDANPSKDIAKYSFNVGTHGKNGDLILNFYDYPGEFITDPIHRDKVLEYMASSRILVITIDTPHMMEEEQRFDDIRNIEKRITEMIKRSEFASKDKGPGLVLFVPLKCERYLNDDRMGEVTAQVKNSYSALINYLQSGDNNIIIAITPIFTFGGAAFSRFKRDNEGEILINQRWHDPEEPIYYFPDMNKSHPEPKYCEQPLLYILWFVLNEAARRKANRGWLASIFGGLWDIMLSIPSLDDYLQQRNIIDRHVKTKDDGYYIY